MVAMKYGKWNSMRWENNASVHVAAKRGLGEGRWDKILKRKLVELSVADNYDEAKEEWKATGKCWWRSFSNRNKPVPDWVVPHMGHCLCGHEVRFHFQIENTSNGTIEAVGSDHITSYLILREIAERTGVSVDNITEKMIKEWIDVRVKAMKAEAWWEENGELFERDFNNVKDLDLRINVQELGKKYFDKVLKMYRPQTRIRKRAKGMFGTPEYEMASVVWRWNHPDNKKNQQTVHGIPNERLIGDIAWFLIHIEKHKARVVEMDEFEATRKKELLENDIKFKDAVISSVKEEKEDHEFSRLCDSYGVRYFDRSYASNKWEEDFIKSCRRIMIRGNRLSAAQSQTLVDIVNRHFEPATDNQTAYLRRLNFEGDYALLTKKTASIFIEELKEEK